MAPFFRKLKLKLVDEGNMKRYLMYAIGEILLLVIGILIAFGCRQVFPPDDYNRLKPTLLVQMSGGNT